ncbi:hypothetical protein Trydic_g9734 [Trypoxylus dichotomus]
MKSNENIDEYINELRRLSNNCESGTLTDSLIKDRTVFGIKDKALKNRLLREANLDLRKAIDICKVGHYSRICKVRNINTVDKGSDEEVELFIGCLNGTYHIEIDKTVKPVIHPPRKVPFALKNKLKRKLESLVKQTAIEKVTGATDWEKVAFDLFTLDGSDYLLGVDYYSKFVEVSKLNITTAKEVIDQMKSIFSRQGIPKLVVSDNGPQFNCRDFGKFASEYGFTHVTSSPRYAQEGTDPYLALLMLRNTPISSEIPSPAQILYSRRLRDILPARGKMLRKTIVNDRLIQGRFEENKHKQ